MVGYTGCAMPYKKNSPTVKAYVSGLAVTNVIQGTEGGAGSDSITVSYAQPETGIRVVDSGGTSRASPLYVSKNLPLYQALSDNFTSGTPVPITLLVGNCDVADIFVVTGVADATAPTTGAAVGSIEHAAGVPVGGVSNTSAELSEIYGTIGDHVSTVFQRADVTYDIDTVSGVTGLYESRNGGAKQLVLDNVTDMEILYGIDSPSAEDGNADNYQNWSAALPVADITSVKITLTMIVTQEEGVNVTRNYSFTIKLRDMGLDV